MHDRHKLIRLARTRRGLTHREVAQLVDVPEARISKLENGKQPVTEATLQKYRSADLITRDEQIAALLGEAA
jgi:transcriptional regulator with XRE-family HTH domain